MNNFYSNRQATLFQHNPFEQSIKITPCAGGANVKTPYSPRFVDEMKANIPFAHRAWDGNLKVWRIGSAYISEICKIIENIYGYCPDVEMPAEDNSFESQTYLLEYIGRAKERSDGSAPVALGYCSNGWNVVFSESVLREFFEGEKPAENAFDQSPDKALNFYQLLGVKMDVPQVDIKKAYYRMAKQWHPDVCRESDARERFEAINNAYKLLSEPKTRKRYDAGLAFQIEAEKAAKDTSKRFGRFTARYGYAPPLRCGILTLDGEYSIGKIIVSKIRQWDDWTENGRTAVSSWNMTEMNFEVQWV